MRAQRTLCSTIALVLLSAAILALPLARGGVDWPTQACAAAVLMGAWALAGRDSSGFTGATLALLAVVAGLLLQLAPVPPWAHVISPATRRTFDLALRPLGAYPAPRPLSLDPPATGGAVLHAIAVLAAFSCAAFYAEARARRRVLVFAVAGSGTAVALLALTSALFGVAPLLAPDLPFVDPNHLASACCLSALVALGLALRDHGGRRALWLLAFVVCGAMVLLSLSRAGIAALLFGCGVFSALLLRPTPGVEQPARGRHAFVGVAVSVVLAVGAFLALDPVLAELRTMRAAAHDSKLQLLPIGLRMVGDFPLLGIGRGAFATAFTAYKSDPIALTFTHLESSWLQPAIDMGLPLGVLLVGTFALTWLRAARRTGLSPTDVGLLAGTAAVAFHDAADFSLELLGVAVPFAVALGIVAREPRWFRLPRPAFLSVLGLLAVTGAGGLLIYLAHPTRGDERPVVEASDASHADAAARKAVVWHPADYLPQAVAGARWIGEGRCGEAFPWLMRAMTLNPTAAEPHRFAARCLAAAGQPGAARVELRLAIAYGDPAALSVALSLFPALDDLLEVVPDTPDDLFGLARHLAQTRPSDAAIVLRRLVDSYADERAELPLARLLLATNDPAGALEVARHRARSAHAEPEVFRIASEALTRLGRDTEAGEELERGLAVAPGAQPIVSALADRAFAARRYSESRRLAEEMAVHTPTEAAERELLISRALAAQGRFGEAIERARAAAAVRPDWPAPLETVAQLCRMAHRYEDAIAALEAARGLFPERGDAYQRTITAVRSEEAAQQRERQERLLLQDEARGATAPDESSE